MSAIDMDEEIGNTILQVLRNAELKQPGSKVSYPSLIQQTKERSILPIGETLFKSALSYLLDKQFIKEQAAEYQITPAGLNHLDPKPVSPAPVPPNPTPPDTQSSIPVFIVLIIAAAIVWSAANSRNGSGPGTDATSNLLPPPTARGAISGPEQAVIDYYADINAAINNGDYQKPWSRLNGHFKDNNRCADFVTFLQSWGDTRQVSLNGTKVITQSTSSARLTVDITYFGTKQSSVQDPSFLIGLSWDGAQNQWVFSTSSPLSTAMRYCP